MSTEKFRFILLISGILHFNLLSARFYPNYIFSWSVYSYKVKIYNFCNFNSHLRNFKMPLIYQCQNSIYTLNFFSSNKELKIQTTIDFDLSFICFWSNNLVLILFLINLQYIITCWRIKLYSVLIGHHFSLVRICWCLAFFVLKGLCFSFVHKIFWIDSYISLHTEDTTPLFCFYFGCKEIMSVLSFLYRWDHHRYQFPRTVSVYASCLEVIINTHSFIPEIALTKNSVIFLLNLDIFSLNSLRTVWIISFYLVVSTVSV